MSNKNKHIVHCLNQRSSHGTRTAQSCKTVKKGVREGGGGLAELPDRNPCYPTFSNAVKILYEEGRGRFAVAKRAVKVGELLAREVAAVAMIEERRATSHCW